MVDLLHKSNISATSFAAPVMLSNAPLVGSRLVLVH